MYQNDHTRGKIFMTGWNNLAVFSLWCWDLASAELSHRYLEISPFKDNEDEYKVL